MKDDQNNPQSLQITNSDQQSGGQQGQGDFYVDPNDPYANQQQGNDPALFPGDAPQTEQFSSVSGVSGNKKIAVVVLLSISLGVMMFIFMPEKKTEKQVQQEEKTKLEVKKDTVIKAAKPITMAEDMPKTENLPPPKLLEPPPISTPKPPAPPPAPLPVAPVAPAFPTDDSSGTTPAFPSDFGNTNPTSSVFSSKEEEEAKKRAADERRKASIMVIGGGGDSGGGLTGGKDKKATDDKGAATEDKPAAEKKKTSGDGFLGFGDGSLNEQVLSKTGSPQVKATYLGRLDSTIAQGKIIDAVLETAVNTDLPGTLRAIVSRDVYAESGKAVLVPKGSRVIGTYAVEVKAGQSRVSVTWDRLIRPDGIDLALNAPGTDTLGRSGVAGFLDDKMMTKLATAFLVSYIIPTVANKLSNVNDKSISQTQTAATDGSTTTTTTGASVGSSQLKESADKFKEITQKSLEDAFSTKSTIYVDQGTRINIFVNQDIVFPPQIALNSMTRVVK